MPNTRILCSIALVGLLPLAACAKKTAGPGMKPVTEGAGPEVEPAPTGTKGPQPSGVSAVPIFDESTVPMSLSVISVSQRVQESCDIPETEAYFGFDSANLTQQAKQALAKIADCIEDDEKNRVVALEGHADPRGSDQYNMQLGMSRAESVEQFLVSEGVKEERLLVSSEGEVEAEKDAEGWPYARRVDIRYVDVQAAN